MKRSSVNKLPPEVKAWLDQALVEGNFTGYQSLADDLQERGFTLSRSAIQRYGQAFEEQLGNLKRVTEQARIIIETTPDDANAMGDALTRLVQQKAFAALSKVEDIDGMSLPAISRIVADMNKYAVAQKKWAVEVREKLQAAADVVEKHGRRGGMSQETVEMIKRKILGLAPQE